MIWILITIVAVGGFIYMMMEAGTLFNWPIVLFIVLAIVGGLLLAAKK